MVKGPAIILITADELRADVMGCYGGQAIRTPHIDQLANTATRFDQAYTVSPWCLPSRSAIITGQFPHHNGSYGNFRERPLNPDIPNLYTILRGIGYTTAHIGKCHYAPVAYGQPQPDRILPYDDFDAFYRSLGIDHLTLQDGKQVSVWFADDYSKDLAQAGYLDAYRAAVWDRSNGKVFAFPGPAAWHPDSWVGRKATEYIETFSGDRSPFLWVSFSGPHFPFDAPDEYLGRVDAGQVGTGVFRMGELDDPRRIHHRSFHGPGGIEGGQTNGTKSYSDAYWTELRTRYLANVALIDDQVGRILDAVERRFGNDAVVIFTADHGEMLGNHRLWGKNNCAYEDVLRVPLLARASVLSRGVTTDARVMLTDLFATCLQAAGVAGVASDGISLIERITTGGCPYVFSEGEQFLTVSDGTMKYVRLRRDDGQFAELFDLARDPYEFENVIERPEYARSLTHLQTAALDLFTDALLP